MWLAFTGLGIVLVMLICHGYGRSKRRYEDKVRRMGHHIGKSEDVYE
jgi:hypothetical protein